MTASETSAVFQY